ncbi:unnamed protein product [Nezara viridula]|uniref:Neuropeptide n=1 Tax=Nezara viridula TaxID=85310 RepID=A0A9P0HJ57_NEZVI|nr:unnamed protein product [Nezara viridula]
MTRILLILLFVSATIMTSARQFVGYPYNPFALKKDCPCYSWLPMRISTSTSLFKKELKNSFKLPPKTDTIISEISVDPIIDLIWLMISLIS